MASLLAQLFGGGLAKPVDPQGATGLPPAAEAAQAPIPVQGRNPFHGEGLLGGTFQVGRTGGNILGILGDSLLVQAGRDPIYHPRLNRERAAAAMEGFADDPLSAIGRLAKVDQKGARDLWDDYQRNLIDQEKLGLERRAKDFDYEQGVLQTGISLAGTATPETFPAVMDRVKQFYAARGVEPPFALPTSYEELARFRNAGMSPKDQAAEERQRMATEGLQDYRGERLDDFDADRELRAEIAAMNESGRNSRAAASRAASKSSKPTERRGQTPRGVVEIDKTGVDATYTLNNGTKIRYKKAGNKWVPLGRIVPTEEGASRKEIYVNGKWVQATQ